MSVNGEMIEIQEGTTLAGLLEGIGTKMKGPCVVAVNDEHVPRAVFGKTSLAIGDRVEILTVRQGG